MKKFISLIFSSVLFFTGFAIFTEAKAGLLYPYHRLAVKNLDQMNKIVQDKIKESKKSKGDRTVPLKEALQAVLSRPNDDFMVEKVIPPIRNELEELSAWESSVRALVKESSGALKNPKAFKPEALTSYAIFLENLIAEFKPKAGEEFEKSVLEQIRDANIVLPDKVKNERNLRMMKVQSSPSEIAKAVLSVTATGEPKK